MLSSSPNPTDPASWTLHGELLPGTYTGGASLLFRAGDAAAPHLAFVSDSNTANTLLLAESAGGDPTRWRLRTGANDTAHVFMRGRRGCWDEAGVAAGPQPERLSSGDFLYVYNIDTGFPYQPNPPGTPYLGRCALGWAVLDGDDPSRVVARSAAPLLTADLAWENCVPEGKGRTCQEPHVVFSTGMKPLGGDEFLVFYGAADTDVGAAHIKVRVGPPQPES